MTDADIQAAIARHTFYHIIPLTGTIATPGNPEHTPVQKIFMRHLESLDLKGKRVLDIGCRDGLFSFAAEKLGAAEVVGIDNDISKPATEFLIPYFKSKVRMIQMNLYDLKSLDLGRFDVILFPGVLYHLRYPFWGLKAIRDMQKPGGHLLIETAIWRGDPNNAMLFCPIDNESPYEGTSCTFFNEKGLTDTLTSLGYRTHAVEFLPRRPPRHMGDRLNRLRMDFMDRFIPCLHGGDRPPIRRVRRAVFHSVFTGHDQNAFVNQYWEQTHQFHSKHGG